MHTIVIINVYEIKRDRLCCHVFAPHPGVSLYSVMAFQDDIGLAINEKPWFALFLNPLKHSGNAYVPHVLLYETPFSYLKSVFRLEEDM
jgi:hypothetical protein